MNMDIEKLETLPKKVGRKGYLTTKYGDMYDLRSFDNPWYRSNKMDVPWFIVKITLKKFLGKSFADAFSYYCSKVEQRYQDDFLDKFRNKGYRHSWYADDYIIDSDGNIQLNPERYQRKRKTNFTVISHDYKSSYFHKITKEEISYKLYHHWTTDRSMYDEHIISGYERTFESKKDPEYKRMMAEITKHNRISSKRWKKEQRQKAFSFLTRDEKQKKEDRKLNILTRDRHGFDNESFKTNPYQNSSEEIS